VLVLCKADLIDEVSRLAELTRKDSEVIVENIFDSVVRSTRGTRTAASRTVGGARAGPPLAVARP